MSLSNGCICCSIREDLIREVRNLAEQNRFDCLIVESTGVSLPLPVAATFGLAATPPPASDLPGGDLHDHHDEVQRPGAASVSPLSGLADVARLDSLVTVVDAQRFVSNVLAAESLQERGIAVDETDDRTVADLLIEQVRA